MFCQPIAGYAIIQTVTIIFFLFLVKSHNVLVKHLKLKTNHEDFEFKKLLINLMVVLSQQQTNIHVSNITII